MSKFISQRLVSGEIRLVFNENDFKHILQTHNMTVKNNTYTHCLSVKSELVQGHHLRFGTGDFPTVWFVFVCTVQTVWTIQYIKQKDFYAFLKEHVKLST